MPSSLHRFSSDSGKGHTQQHGRQTMETEFCHVTTDPLLCSLTHIVGDTSTPSPALPDCTDPYSLSCGQNKRMRLHL